MTRSVIKHILLIAASVIMIYPLLWLMASSLRPTEVIFRTPGLWLNDLYVENYTKGWYSLSYPFGQYIINSAIVVIGAIAGNLFACTLAAYAFARLKFRLQGAVVRHHAVDAHAALPRGRGAAVHPLQRAGLGEHVRSADLAQVPGHRCVLRVLDGPVHPRHSQGAGRGGHASTVAATGRSSAG